MMNASLKGRRYIRSIRCSKDQQAGTSPQDQGRVLDEYARNNGLIHAGHDIILEGVSGSLPSARGDIEQIIAHKKQHNDFEVLLVQDYSRFTRAGLEHGGALVWELAKAGIHVVFVTAGSTGNADQDGLIQSMGFYAAQQAAKSISYATTRGVMSSRAAGKIPHTVYVPYGVDRLYVGPKGEHLHRIRNLADGTQHLIPLDGEGKERTFAKNPKKGASTHYKRQADERIVFVPGAPERVEIVRRIFREKLIDGDGGHAIARRLNNELIASPTGKLWGKDSVSSVLKNPVYTGMGISGRYATGIYHVHGEEASPEEVDRQLTTIAQRKKSQKSYRRKEDWKWMEYPELADYLGDLRELAVAMQQKEFARQDRIAAGIQPKQKPGGDKHLESPYILKDVLRSVQGDYRMTGRRAGSGKNPPRYYAVTRGASTPKDGSPLARMIPAEPLEKAVLGVIKEVLKDTPGLRKHIVAAIAAEQQTEEGDRGQLDALLAEQAVLKEQIADAMRLGPSIRRLMDVQFKEWETQSVALDERIAKATAARPTPTDATAIIKAVELQFRKWVKSFDTLAPSAIRKLIGSLVSNMHVDLETREVQMELAIADGFETAFLESKPVCLDEKPLWPSRDEAHRFDGLKIAFIECQGRGGTRSVPSCYSCSRKAAA